MPIGLKFYWRPISEYLEILVSLFGLFLGYWVISKLITGKKIETDNQKKPEQDKNSKNDFEQEMAEDQDWYVVLGVSRNASIDEVQTAYKSLIRQYHPDKVASLGEELRTLAERKSKAINVAYKQAQELRGGGS